MKMNGPNMLKLQRKKLWLLAKHARLYFDLLQALKGEPLAALGRYQLLVLQGPIASCKVGWGQFNWYSIQLKSPGKILTQVQVPGAARRFSPRIKNLQCRLLQRPYSPCVQSQASVSVHTLKIPNTGSHTIVWTHKNTAHAERNG